MKKCVFNCFQFCIPASEEESDNNPIPEHGSSDVSIPLCNFGTFQEEPLFTRSLLAEYDHDHSSYLKLQQIGEGSFSNVFKGIRKRDNTEVALKSIKLYDTRVIPGSTISEISILKMLNHHNIVRLIDVISNQQSLTIVLEYVEEDLKNYIKRKKYLNTTNMKLFLFQILRGISYFHGKNIIHRDLKPSNILVNERGELKMADFNLARTVVPLPRFSPQRGTRVYRAPEILGGSTNYSQQTDMWSVGCIFYEMATGHLLFPGKCIESTIAYIEALLGPIGSPYKRLAVINSFHHRAPRLNIDGLILLSALITYENEQRISASKAMTCDYFDSLGPDIHKLSDDSSIFCIPYIQLGQDPEESDV